MINRLPMTVLLIAVIAGPASALTCMPPDTRQYYEEHRYIFTGYVESVREVGELAVRQEEGLTNSYSFAVVKLDQLYKGRMSGARVLKVFANDYWGAPFKAGRKYLFYVNMQGAFMIAPECGGITPLDQAADQLEILAEIRP